MQYSRMFPPYCICIVKTFLKFSGRSLRLWQNTLRLAERLIGQIHANWNFRFRVMNFTWKFVGGFFHSIPLL